MTCENVTCKIYIHNAGLMQYITAVSFILTLLIITAIELCT